VEIFRRLARLSKGVNTTPGQWLEESIQAAGPGGNYLKQSSTAKAVREGVWYMSEIGFHDTYEKWKLAGMPDVVDTLHETVKSILKDYQPLLLNPDVERELERLEQKANESDGN
jgi:trimethylamine:corrinoid methyltransferase-like protein